AMASWAGNITSILNGLIDLANKVLEIMGTISGATLSVQSATIPQLQAQVAQQQALNESNRKKMNPTGWNPLDYIASIGHAAALNSGEENLAKLQETLKNMERFQWSEAPSAIPLAGSNVKVTELGPIVPTAGTK